MEGLDGLQHSGRPGRIMYDASAIESYTTPSGLKRHRLPAMFPPLRKHRYIASDIPLFALHKAVLQDMLWRQMAETQAITKRRKLGFEMNAKRRDLTVQQKQMIAEGRTEIAQHELRSAFQVLAVRLNNPLKFDWNTLKKYPEYPEEKPVPPKAPDPPAKPIWPREPLPGDAAFQPKTDAMGKLLRTKRDKRMLEARQRYEDAHKKWKQLCARMHGIYKEQANKHKEVVQQLQQEHQNMIQAWEADRERYLHERESSVKLVEEKAAAYAEHDPNAILDFFDMALAWSLYPASFPHSYEMDYDAQNRLLTVDYLLPPLRVMPILLKVSYKEKNNTYKEILLSDDERNAWYVRLLHEMPLRTFHEMFSVDAALALESIDFRGYLFLSEEEKSPKPPVRVLNIQADRAIFEPIDLRTEDPIALFEELGGEIRSLE